MRQLSCGAPCRLHPGTNSYTLHRAPEENSWQQRGKDERIRTFAIVAEVCAVFESGRQILTDTKGEKNVDR